MSSIKAITLLWILIEFTLIVFPASLNFRPKVFKLEIFENCPGSENLTGRYRDVNIMTPKLNLYSMSGFIDVDHNVTVQLAISLAVQRCSLDRTHCEDYDHLTIPKLCDKFRDVTAFWTPMVNMIKPPPSCPILGTTYRFTNATANLDIVSRLPLEGYRWVVQFTIHPDRNPKKIFMCTDIEVSITNQKRRRH